MSFFLLLFQDNGVTRYYKAGAEVQQDACGTFRPKGSGACMCGFGKGEHHPKSYGWECYEFVLPNGSKVTYSTPRAVPRELTKKSIEWINEARDFAASRHRFGLSPIQAKTLALLLELRGEGRPAVATSGSGVRKITLKSLAKRDLVRITEEKDGEVTAELIT